MLPCATYYRLCNDMIVLSVGSADAMCDNRDDSDETAIITLFTLSNNTTTRGHSAKLIKNRCRLDLRRHFFSERVTERWNQLPQDVFDSRTIDTFKSKLDKLRIVKIGFFTELLSAKPYGLIWNQVRQHQLCTSYARRLQRFYIACINLFRFMNPHYLNSLCV